MRQIESMVEFVSKVLFQKEKIEYSLIDKNNLSETDMIFCRLSELLKCGKLCEAENFLFSSHRIDRPEHLKLAIDFYQRLNQLSDEQLMDGNFSREEIREGFDEILKLNRIDIPEL